ncbi:Uncharacterised protein [Chlamydia trachomatis]|nr:Uncharacterised protein [Chlamydia trachomatis]
MNGFGILLTKLSRGPIGKHTVIRMCEINAQSTNGTVVFGDTRIGVKGQRHLYGDVQTSAAGIAFRPTGQPVHPFATCLIIVFVIVFSGCGAINTVWYARPLHPVACCFGETRVGTCFWSAYIPHSSTYLNSVGCHHFACFSCLVTEDYALTFA